MRRQKPEFLSAHFLLQDLEHRLISRASRSCGQEVAHRRDGVAIPADHFADVGAPHVDLENQLTPLLHSGHQYLVRRVDQLPNNKLEEALHDYDLRLCCRRLLFCFANHARNRFAWLGTIFYPIFHPLEVELIILSLFARIVIPYHFKKFPVSRTPLVCDNHTVKWPVFGSFSPQSDRN
jgi:hypothetical protein